MPTGKKMKVIKFRAWDKQEKKMVLNPLVTDIDDPANYIGLNDLPKKFADKGFELMQFTGLKDKNGKEIYEGDIVKCENGNFEVKWGQPLN